MYVTRQDTLPRGPHSLTGDQVRASQRQRILATMLELAGQNGYAATSVTAIVNAARVSKSAFYAQFPDKLTCFLAACEDFVEACLAGMVEAGVGETAAIDGMAAGNDFARSLATTQRHAARCVFVELPALGLDGAAVHRRMIDGAVDVFLGIAAWFRVEDPSLPALLPHAGRGAIAGTFALAGDAVTLGTDEALQTAMSGIFTLWLLAATGRVDEGRWPRPEHLR